MKKFVLTIAIVLLGTFSAPGLSSLRLSDSVATEQKKDDKGGKKDPPGPPVVTPKQPKDKGGDKRPDTRPKPKKPGEG